MTYSERASRQRCLSRESCHGLTSGTALAVMLAILAAPAEAVSVSANYFALADNGSFIGGDADFSITRSRAVVDSGFVHHPIFVAGNQGDWTWQAKASANLATGSLRTYAFSDTTESLLPDVPPLPSGGWRSQSNADFADVLTFMGPANAPAGPPVPVTLRMDVRGRFAGFLSTMTNTTFLMVSGSKAEVDFTWTGRQGPDGTIDATATTLGTVTNLSIDPDQLHALLQVTVPVVPGSPLALSGHMFSKSAAGSFASATTAFDHTATLSIEVPAGYTFTSQSGVLLTVPEPAAWLSLLAGLGVMAMPIVRAVGARLATITGGAVNLCLKVGNRWCSRYLSLPFRLLLLMTVIGAGFAGAAEPITEPITLSAVGFGASAFPAGDHTEFNEVYLPFRQSGGDFAYGANLVSSPGARQPFAYHFESQYGAFGGSTPTLRLTTAASGNSLAGVGNDASVSEFYELAVDVVQPLPAGATTVPVELPVRVSLLATQLPPGPPELNTISEITARITKTERSSPTIQYLMNIIGACLNISLPVCDGNNVTFESVLHFDVNPNVPTRLGMILGSSVRPLAYGHFDGYAHGSIDPLPRLSLSADPQAYGLPAGSKFSDYYALRFSPNLYTVAQLPIPEPSSWLLCLLGLGAMAFCVLKAPSKWRGVSQL